MPGLPGRFRRPWVTNYCFEGCSYFGRYLANISENLLGHPYWYLGCSFNLRLWIIIEPSNLLQVEVVGFEETSYHEREAVGQLQVCMRVTVPPITEPLNQTFSLSMSTWPGTAGKFVFAYCSKDVILFSCGPHL